MQARGGPGESLLDNHLVDEYPLFVHPVVLGQGKRLFAEGSALTAMRRIDTKLTAADVAVSTYQPAGRPEYGSFPLPD